MKKKISFGLIAVILFAGFILVNSSIVVTYPNEYTVIKQFGRIEKIYETPGLSMKIPFIQTTER